MKYVIFLLLITGCVKKDTIQKKDVHICQVDDARWNEKQRWYKYITDSVYDKAFPVRLNVAVGLITPKQGFDSLSKLIDKARTPYYK